MEQRVYQSTRTQEVFRKLNILGKKFRIVKTTTPVVEYFEVESAKEFHFEDGDLCIAWYPAVEPIKVFATMEEAMEVLEQLCAR